MLVLSEVLYALVLFSIGSSTTVFHLILSLIAFGMMANLMTIDPSLFLLGLMGFAGMFCEGTVYDWSSVYFSSVVKPDEAFIRAGYVAGMG